jgi:tetratricopeptide (TPR) repeat protein
MQDRSADAERHYQEALAVYRQIADRLGEANALLGLGEAARMQDRSADAERHYQEALAVSRQIADRRGEANALWGLGEAARMQARFADARGYLVQAFDLYDAIGMTQDTLRFAIINANAALDQIESGAAHRQAHRRQAAELARWLLARAENASTQCAPAIAAASTVRLQALRLRIANL